ncbi:thioredoxin domain-containing protein [Halorhabdus sp. BNX81]|uniref:DsbA family protein n=1 Tax=Halorhabdus sp. BNX81 TaxID=2980181 RepID=UPI0023DD20A8|nr:thioredoxin domain-containing protein [Halorhabdus sp. BNX81]WEL21349.1 Protein-disulfide isomerase [Halorhabdus sp. BNX81]
MTDDSAARSTRRAFIGGLAVAGTAGLAGCGGLFGGQANVEVPDGPVANAPIPSDASEYVYETMGTNDAPVTATYVANWKCPHCADFSTGFLGTIVEEYVEPGALAIEHRALAYINGNPWMGTDAPRAAEAGLAVWHTDPASYWQYHEYVMASQGDPRETWATTDRLVGFAEDVGVSDVDAVRTAIEDRTYKQRVQATATAVSQTGISSTPTLVIDGEAVNALNESAVRTTLDEKTSNA